MDNLNVCEYCGQILAEPGTVCKCPKAVMERARQERIDAGKSRIYQLFGDKAAEYGFYPMENHEAVEIMERAVELIANHKISSVTLAIGQGTRAKLATGAGGRITVERSQSQKYKLEE